MKQRGEADGHPLRERNIILIGFMGAGKTTIGQLVAKKLYRDFIDVDAEIERRHGMSIPEMFAQKGEAYFRQVERELIVDLCTNTRLKILSLGGGAYLQEDVRRACLAHGIVFSLTCRGSIGRKSGCRLLSTAGRC